MKKNSKKLRLYSIIVSFLLVLSSSYIAYSNPEDVGNMFSKLNNYIKTKISETPQIDINYLGATPQKAMVGEEIVAKYEVDPKPFKKDLKEKEIVFVVDTSKSMQDDLLTVRAELREFVLNLRNTPNIKIGVVGYNTEATVHGMELRDTNDPELLKAINAIGHGKNGINIGDGMRKAEYMFSQGNDAAQKTVILLGKNKADEYTNYGAFNHDYYLEINNRTPNTSGSEKWGREYALLIGDIMKKNDYNVYTVSHAGIDINNDNNKSLLEIHQSMGGDKEDFFVNSIQIRDILKNITNDVVNGYKVKSVDLNFEISDEIDMIQNANKDIRIDYKKDADGWYRAQKQIIEFKFKAKSLGEIHAIKNMNLKYKDIDKQIVSKNAPDTIINIENPKLPNIDINYMGVKPQTASVGQEIVSKYEIDPKPFKMESKPKEIVFVFDQSESMNWGGRLERLKGAMADFVLKLRDTPDVKIGVVGFGNNAHIYSELKDSTDDELIKIIRSIGRGINANNTGDGMRKAEYVFSKGNSEAERVVILLGEDSPRVYTHTGLTWEYYLKINNKNAVTLASVPRGEEYAIKIGEIMKKSNPKVYTVSYDNSSMDSNNNKSLLKIHQSMGGKKEDFLFSDIEVNTILDKIVNEIKGYEVKDANLNFEISNDIDITQNINKNIDIQYKKGEDGWYRAEKQVVEFKFRGKRTGEIRAITNMNLTYKGIDKNVISKDAPDTIIKLKDELIPNIDLNYIGIEPQNPVVGDEVTVNYELDPHPFKLSLPPPPPQEIVLVLDRSGSMKDKIYGLKDAAKRFIRQLKDIENLKIGIVTYSKGATIDTKPNLLDVSDPKLITLIDKIEVGGGTNTGEGMRKGEYVLEKGDINAKKTIIMMSDGLPSVYSKGKNNQYYTDIDDTNPKTENSERKAKEYAMKIGEKISVKPYDIFTIGYGLGNSNSNANKILKDIHKSMGGKEEQFYATDDKIDEIFKGIGDSLSNSYEIENTKIEFNFSKDIQMTQMFDTVPKINYKLESDGWYRAPKIPIVFKFKILKPGNIDVVTNPTFTYDQISVGGGKGETIEVTGGNCSITVKDRNLMIAHGLLNRKNNVLKIGQNQQNVIKDMYYNVGVNIDIKEDYSRLTITPPKIDMIDINTIKIYYHDGSGNIISQINNPSINIEGNNIVIDEFKKGNYIVSYNTKFNQSNDILAELERENKIFKAIIKMNESGSEINNPSLPELF